MIYVTHDQIEAMTLADRIAVMSGGVIQQLDAPQTIYERPVNRFVAGFIGSPAMNFLDRENEGRAAARCSRPMVLRVPLDRYAFDGTARPTGARVGIRPEHMLSGSAAQSMPIFRQRFGRDRRADGLRTLVWCRIGRSTTLSVRLGEMVTARPRRDIADFHSCRSRVDLRRCERRTLV